MSLPDDLLKQAKKLATMEKKRPQQASLRRAVSTAYYALFHLLCEDGAKRISPNTPVRLSHAIRRSITHGDMKSAAKGINQPTPPTRDRNRREVAGILLHEESIRVIATGQAWYVGNGSRQALGITDRHGNRVVQRIVIPVHLG